ECLLGAPALVGQRRIVTGNQPLVWIGLHSQFEEVRVGKAPEVECAAVDQRPDRRMAQRRNPIEALDRLEFLANAGVGQQPPVPDEDHPTQMKTLPQLRNYWGHGGWITRVPLEDFDRDWTAFGIADQPKDNLDLPLFAIAGVSKLGQRTRMALEVGRSEIIEGQRPLTEVAFGQGRFQLRLAAP